MTALLAGLAALAGFTALCLAMPRHHRQLRKTAPRRRTQWLLRSTGAAGLALALLFSGQAWGWSIGPVAWLGLLTLAGLTLAFLLPLAERLVRRSRP
jgi:hypothetical protein